MKLSHSCRKLLLLDEHESPPVLVSTTINSTSGNAQLKPIYNSPFDSSMALTILVLLTAIFFMAFFSVYIRRFSADSSDFHRRRTTTPAAPSTSTSRFNPSKFNHRASAVGSLPLISYSGDASRQIDCIICLTEFDEEEKVKMIPCCRHVFHPDCIDTWLASHVSCPLCRSTKMDEVCSSEMQEGPSERRRWRVDEGETWRDDIRRTRSLSNLGTSSCVALHRSTSF